MTLLLSRPKEYCLANNNTDNTTWLPVGLIDADDADDADDGADADHADIGPS